MICFMQFIRQSFSHMIWRRLIPYTWFWLRAHSGCDRPAEDPYSSSEPDPTSGVKRGPCNPYFHSELFHVLDMDTGFDCELFHSTCLNSPILIVDCSVHLIWTHWFWSPILEFEVGLTADVTGRQRMFTPPRHYRICRRSVLPYTRFCNCVLNYAYV
jgi:hypothetical protein